MIDTYRERCRDLDLKPDISAFKKCERSLRSKVSQLTIDRDRALIISERIDDLLTYAVILENETATPEIILESELQARLKYVKEKRHD